MVLCFRGEENDEDIFVLLFIDPFSSQLWAEIMFNVQGVLKGAGMMLNILPLRPGYGNLSAMATRTEFCP